MDKLRTWNTWDVRCLNGVMKAPEMAEIRISLYDDSTKFFLDEMLWDNVKRFGYHDAQGGYFDIDFIYGDFVFNMEFAGAGESFVCKITPNGHIPYIKFFVQGMFRWNADGTILKKGRDLLLKSGNSAYEIKVVGNIDDRTPINVSHPGVLAESDRVIYIKCNNDMGAGEMLEFLRQGKERCESALVKGDGSLCDTPQAVVKGLMWNSIYEPVKDRFCTPVTRAWCARNGGHSFGAYVLFCWDTFFAGLLSGIQDKELAYQQVYSILQEISQNGFAPNCGAQVGISEDRSQPPVGSYCVLKLFKQFREKSFLQNCFDKLLRWNKWWMANRDGNGDGLLEWGSDPCGTVEWWQAHNLQAAKFESGLDNSPMYDDAGFDEASHTMELADVGLNSLYAMDCQALAAIAAILGNDAEAGRLEDEYLRVKELVNEELWNEERGIYCNKYWRGGFGGRLSPTSFYPMIAGIATEERAKRMVEEHLLNESEFWGQYVIPSISKSDPGYFDNDYWRGRIWAPMNFLVSEGLKRYGFHDVSFDFSKKSLDLFRKEWAEENHIHENYNSITGDGDDVKNADPVYTWGGLLGYIAIGELIEFQPWGALRLGNLSEEKSSVFNYPVGNDRYDVINDNGLTVRINGGKFIETSTPVIIADLREENDMIAMKITYRKSGELSVRVPAAVKTVKAEANGKRKEFSAVRDEVTIPLE